MLVSQDLDCTSTLYIQLSFKFITKGKCLDNFIIAIWNSKYCICFLIFCFLNMSSLCWCVLRNPRAFSFRVAAVFSEWRDYLATVA